MRRANCAGEATKSDGRIETSGETGDETDLREGRPTELHGPFSSEDRVRSAVIRSEREVAACVRRARVTRDVLLMLITITSP